MDSIMLKALLGACLAVVGTASLQARPEVDGTVRNDGRAYDSSHLRWNWLGQCSQCVGASIVAAEGIGTSSARAEGRIRREDFVNFCETRRSPEECKDEGMHVPAEIVDKTYVATADCPGGRITTIWGDTFTLDGIHSDGILAGRTRWRDSSGRIAEGTIDWDAGAIAQNWEVLCTKREH